MPLYRVRAKRCYEEEYLVRADSEEEAKTSTEIVEEMIGATDSWADELLEVELVEDDEDVDARAELIDADEDDVVAPE